MENSQSKQTEAEHCKTQKKLIREKARARAREREKGGGVVAVAGGWWLEEDGTGAAVEGDEGSEAMSKPPDVDIEEPIAIPFYP
ncbi:unnamed protein product [Prunus armeniaca]|uniref:R domain-containing protein n=1 Tax=Prunus armeniaca TaxID=36596 RepID=A0A6J5TU83_PRUAR|nr:unnamed protein product [Prunus armeniaca]